MNITTSRRPSIPSSIEENKLDTASIASEVTLMTYSDEKAKCIKEEFFKRMEQQTCKLSIEEKEALLREVQLEQEEKFERLKEIADDEQQQKQQQKKKKNSPLEDFFERDFFERLDAFQSEQKKKLIEEAIDNGNTTAAAKQQVTFDRGPQEPEFQHRRGNLWELNASFRSVTTTKHKNSTTALQQHRSSPREDNSYSSDALSKSSRSNDENRERIQELIGLKLQVANQQATIDTLSTKLHNASVKEQDLEAKYTSLEAKYSDLLSENNKLKLMLMKREEDVAFALFGPPCTPLLE